MRILITGGAGYIGSHTIINLLEKGYDLDILDSFCNSHPEALKRVEYLKNQKNIKTFLKFHEGDLRDKNFLEQIFYKSQQENFPIDGFIHFAGLKSVSESIRLPEKYKDYKYQWFNKSF